MGKLKSSIPGLKYLSHRDDSLKTGKGFLDSRRSDDGAENLWRLRNGLYDLSNFAKSHPGGKEFIQMTQGTDITELFETHHLAERAHKLVSNFYVRDAVTSRRIPFTFEHDGFYYKLKKRVLHALKDVNYHKPAKITNVFVDLMLLATIFMCLLAAATKSWIAIFAGALCLLYTTNITHNYLHMKDNFRIYYFDLSLMSSKEFRISHIFSHHMYANTLWDMEMYCFEPFLNWLPQKDYQFLWWRKFSVIYSPIIWMTIFFTQALKRYQVAWVERHFAFRDFVPFLLPLSMLLVSKTFSDAFLIWLLIIVLSSFGFGLIGLNAAHHHPDIFHDGDIYRQNMDWGLFQMDAVRNREVVDDNVFLALTHYGSHCLHHLFPTVDHSYLPLCESALRETCEEFGINDYVKFSQWKLMKGQFQQLTRFEPKYNALTSFVN